jgi:hypothetical protein
MVAKHPFPLERRPRRRPSRYYDGMSDRLGLAVLLLLVLAAPACSNVASDPIPRATRAPNVRCFDQPPAGSPGQDPNARPMFFLFCMQSP